MNGVELSARFLEAAGYTIVRDGGDPKGFLVLKAGTAPSPLPDLTHEEHLGRVVRVVREAGYGLEMVVGTETTHAVLRPPVGYSIDCEDTNLNVAVMGLLVAVKKGGTVPE